MKFLIILISMVVRSSQLSLSDCGSEARRPEYTDIAVTCGTSSITLEIQMCPVIYTGYNETLLILNHQMQSECRGTLDTSVSPPVAVFNFPLNNTHACGSIFRTTSAPGTGAFSDFSNIQEVNISGVVRSQDLTTGTITYNAELKYFYSCAYPLEYLINNTKIDVSASSIALTDRNGTFISTLSMTLFADINYTTPLLIPEEGLELRTQVYVEVKASNLTDQYHVLLDRCYASISALPTNSTFFNLFVPCDVDSLTTMITNGDSQIARFSFSAFRFIEQQNEKVSTYYLHCITRLCEVTTCSTFKRCDLPARRRRSPTQVDATSYTTELTSPEIITSADTGVKENAAAAGNAEDSVVGLGVAVGVLAVACVIALSVSAIFYKRLRN